MLPDPVTGCAVYKKLGCSHVDGMLCDFPNCSILMKYERQICRKCGGKMKPSKAIQETLTGSPDFVGGPVVTVSPGGPGKLVDCLKCEKCGWSVT